MHRINITTWKVAMLLFGSGLCALIYQMAWLREFRLIFGASTAASAAVLAIFMGGLGLGSLLLGHRVDRQARPLRFYGNLELIIAGSAALTPLLLFAVRQAYIATGGSPVLGLTGATVARLVGAALVLVVPTFLMGGTLPAAARSVENDADLGRRNLAMLYGANTLGAVTGSALATFFLVEMFGTHRTLWAACLVNALIALTARSVSAASAQEGEASETEVEAAPEQPAPRGPVRRADPVLAVEPDPVEPAAPPAFVLVASAVVGFAFLLMELVWYRMLGPILGGSTFTFGLILAVALLGIGLGGAAYAILRGNRPATLTGFGLTCALEAVFIGVPFALGDRLALLAMLLRSLKSTGFWGLVLGWTIVTVIAVLPAAFVAGVQFPLLIALLGRGKAAVGRHIGLAYAWNTVGAIVGSLAGGFGVLPLLTAVNTWRAVVVVLAALAGATLAVAAMAAGRAAASRGAASPAHPLWSRLAAPAIAALVALLLVIPAGPTGAWRHSGIGAGRSDHFDVSPNMLHGFVNDHRRWVVKEWDGVESSVALTDASGYSFYVNGKSDGHIRSDAGTQIMGGLVGAIVHPQLKTAMVIGLGTGSTAGWLGRVGTIERVDVVELEPAILEIARACAEGNQAVMTNPKVKVTIGDAREALLTTPNKYDLIFSEPSNPYRAGIASLYTQEFYEACAKRLQPGGLFLQWLQGYEVDGQTVRTVYATLGAVFPAVETWRTQSGDMLLMASREPIRFDVAGMRQRITQEPLRSALAKVWRVTDLEGVFAHHMANADFAKAVQKAERGKANTDDLNFVEFSFARSVGTKSPFGPGPLTLLARSRNEERPVVDGELDWDSVEDQRISSFIMEGVDPPMSPQRPGESREWTQRRVRTAALAHLLRGNAAAALQEWKRQPRDPRDLTERLFMVTAYNEVASEEAVPHIEKIREFQPVEADALLAHLRWRQRRGAEAYDALETSLVGYRSDPWAHFDVMRRTMTLAIDMARGDPSGRHAMRLYSAMSRPFCMHLLEDFRKQCLLKIAAHIDEKTGSRLSAEVCSQFEPNVPWDLDFLNLRMTSYLLANHPLTMLAAEQVDEFKEAEPFEFEFELRPKPATQPTTGPATGPTTGPATQPFNMQAVPPSETRPPLFGGGAAGAGGSAPSVPQPPQSPQPEPGDSSGAGKR